MAPVSDLQAAVAAVCPVDCCPVPTAATVSQAMQIELMNDRQPVGWCGRSRALTDACNHHVRKGPTHAAVAIPVPIVLVPLPSVSGVLA
eukprot:COSAG01_NODE_1260_length_11008_cov_96.487208_6_plen_89_part_00